MPPSIGPPTKRPVRTSRPDDSAIEGTSLQLFAAAAPDPVLITTTNHKVWYANPAWEALTGHSLTNAQDMHIRQLQKSKEYFQAYRQALPLLAEGKPYASQIISDQRPDGSTYRIRLTLFPVKLSNKMTLHIQLQHDLTAEFARQQLQAMAAKIIEYAHDAIIGLDADLRITSWNPAAEKMYGYTANEMIGQSIHEIIPDHRFPADQRAFSGPNAAKSLVNYKTVRMTKKGELIDVETSTAPILDSQGNIQGYSVIHHDITQQEAATRLLRQSETQYRKLMENASEAVLLFNRRRKLIYANLQACQLFGYTKEEITKLHLEDLGDPADKHNHRSKFTDVLAGQVTHTERYFRCKDGRTFLGEITGKLLGQGQVEAIVRDITSRRDREVQKDTLIGIAAHELKTPITTIKAYTQLLDQHLSKNPDPHLKSYLQATAIQVERLAALVNDLLDVSKLEAGSLAYHWQTSMLDPGLKKIITSIKHTITTHKITVHGQTNARVTADFKRLEQVLINLITNAVKYAPDAPQIVIHLKTDGGYAVVSVQDFGPGISKENQSKIFGRFYQVKQVKHKTKDAGGFGLGLYIAAQIIEQHHGQIWVESSPGKGATFSFSLPIFKRG